MQTHAKILHAQRNALGSVSEAIGPGGPRHLGCGMGVESGCESHQRFKVAKASGG